MANTLSASVAASGLITKPRLIVLRGPAGSGKSTIARRVAARALDAGSPVAVLAQDDFRIKILFESADSGKIAVEMICSDAAICLRCGYTVIIEGILNFRKYGSLLTSLFSLVPAEALFIYYFDVCLEETKRRHSQRPKAAEFGPEMLDVWFAAASPTGPLGEVTVPQDLSEGDIVTLIEERLQLQASTTS